MKPIEYIAKWTINTILLSASMWDFLDPILKVIATAIGIVLSFFLIRKAWHDTEVAKEQRRKLKLENDFRDQEIFRMAQENKKRFG